MIGNQLHLFCFLHVNPPRLNVPEKNIRFIYIHKTKRKKILGSTTVHTLEYIFSFTAKMTTRSSGQLAPTHTSQDAQSNLRFFGGDSLA